MAKIAFSASMSISVSPYPKEDVFGGVEAGGIDAGRVGWGSLAHDAAGEAWDGALYSLCVRVTLTARDGVCHHEIYWTFCGTTDLRTKRARQILILHIAIYYTFLDLLFKKKCILFYNGQELHFTPCPFYLVWACPCVCVSLQMTRLAWLILNPKQTLPQSHIVLHPVTHWEFKTTVLITVIKKPCTGICLY